MTYVVDIKTRFIPDDQRMFIVFPGEGYRFYSDMKAKSAVFLDIPGFPLPELLDGAQLNDSDFIKRLTLSQRIKNWHAVDKRDPDKAPIRNLQDVQSVRRTKANIQLAGLIRNFYYNLKKGDIVVVPCREYEDDILFGEVIDDSPSINIEVSRYPQENIPARKVKWIKSIKRDKAPTWFQRKIPIPSAFHQIEQSLFKDVFDIMYQRYYFQENFVCKYAVTSPDFSSLDDFLLQQVMLYVTALYAKNHDENLDGISLQSISALVLGIQRSEYIPDLRININSPGHIVSYSKNIIPIIAGVLLALSSQNAISENAEITTPHVEIINSSDNSALALECQAEVQSEVIEDLKAMGYAHWQEICMSEKSIREHTGLDSGIVVTKD